MNYEFEPQQPDPENQPFSAFVLSPSFSTINEIQKETSDRPENIIVKSAKFLGWAVESAALGLDVYGIPLGSHVAFKLDSPLVDAAKTKTVDETWIKLFEEFQSQAKQDKEGISIQFNFHMAEFLSRIEEVTGIESFEALLNHSPFIFKWALENASKGLFIASFNLNPEERSYTVWDSAYNTRYGKQTESEMIDYVSDFVREEVLLPL